MRPGYAVSSQPPEGDLEETSLTTKSRAGIEPVSPSALSRPSTQSGGWPHPDSLRWSAL